MKAITVRQPWASLIAAGVKTIETRPRRTAYRGRIAIHAGKADPAPRSAWTGTQVGDWRAVHLGGDRFGCEHDGSGAMPLPLGAVVASARLFDCVPVENLINEPTCQPAEPWGAGHYIVDLDRERPLGDYSPGRWALLLDDIRPTAERCPYCWGHGFVDGLFECAACATHGTCDPIPARGQQAVPWEWTP